MSRYLRNGMRVFGDMKGYGWVHGVDSNLFRVCYEHDNQSFPYAWDWEGLFQVLYTPEETEHEAMAMEFLLSRLNRDQVEDLLLRYSRYTQEETSKVLSSRFEHLPEDERGEWIKGWMAAADEASPKWREQNP